MFKKDIRPQQFNVNTVLSNDSETMKCLSIKMVAVPNLPKMVAVPNLP